ncbi:MAG: rhomboid family intramembrane serine protease [Paludibacteraceae bacterium]|nr:rhomboid family intramembrane serine protease [Paludibacteraceae bacterium]
MWDEMRALFVERGFQSVELNNPGMAMYYQTDAALQLVNAVWMISDAEMRNMKRMQYQEYLSAMLRQLRDRAPRIRVTSVFLTNDIDYVNLLASRMDPRMFGFYIINPMNNAIHVDPYQECNTLSWLTPLFSQLMQDDQAKTMAGLIYPDWQNPVLWKQNVQRSEKETLEWYSGRGHRLKCKATLWLIGINTVIFFITLVTIFTGGAQELIEAGGASGETVFGNGQIYRLVTAAFLHGGIDHLIGNMVFLFAFGDVVENYLKVKKYLILYAIAGVGSNLVAVLWRTVTGNYELLGIGASGAIFGIMGAMTMLMYRYPELRKTSKGVPLWAIPAYVVYSVGYPLVLGAITDTQTNIDLAAHIGGFIIGAIVFYILDSKYKTANA